MLTPLQKALVTILASTDAVWLPPRGIPADSAIHVVYDEARSTYRDAGAPWRPDLVESRTVGGRKRAERLLSEALDDGYATAEGATSRRLAAKLTRRGEALARWLAVLPMHAEAAGALARLQDLLARGRYAVDCGTPHLDEVEASGSSYGDPNNGDAIARFEESAMMLLPRRSASTVHGTDGRVWWRVDPKAKAPTLPEDVELVDHDEETFTAAAEHYRKARRAVMNTLAASEPLDPRHVVIPVRACLHVGKAPELTAEYLHHLRHGRGPFQGEMTR